jgi:acetyl-CoA acyltransferase 1
MSSATARSRVGAVSQQLSGSPSVVASARTKILDKTDDDIVDHLHLSLFSSNIFRQVITCALRTPLTKARKGLLKDTSSEELLISILTSIRQKSNLDPALVEDVCVGNVLTPSFGYAARSAVLTAGFPVTTAASVANRFCSSGLLSIQNIASSIASGAIDVGIACGVESMSTDPDVTPSLSSASMAHPVAKDNIQPMGWTSENVAGQFGVTREDMDAYAVISHGRAEHALNQGWVDDEIASVTTRSKDLKTGEMNEVVVTRDDGVRPGSTKEGLAKIRAAFPQWKPSLTTGGNASQITDGAAAVLLMKRSTAIQLGQPILGKFVMSTVVGLEPRIMGIGPSLAIPKLLKKVGLEKDDVDLFEINEAFASMVSRMPVRCEVVLIFLAVCLLCQRSGVEY